MLVNTVFDSLKSDLALQTERIAFEDIFAPLDSVLLYVCQKLLNQHSLVVKLFLLLDQDRGVKLDLSPHLVLGVVKRGKLFVDTHACLEVNKWVALCHASEELLGFLDLIHSSKLHLDGTNFVTQLLIAKI